MKFVANVEINHRLAASYSMPKRRAQRSVLAFGTKPGYPNELVLVHQSNQNSLGTVYKVKDNIEKVFDKYAKDGKTTIRFKEPPHDVIINCEASALERFLAALKMGLRKNVCTKSLKLPVVGSEPLKKVPPKPKQHLIYNSSADYPTSEGFPKTAISIAINGLERTRFDMRLLGLPFLQVLNLSNNKLLMLPPEIDLLPLLVKLSVAHNQFGAARNLSSWSWLHGERLARRLKDLDLSGNEISFLPPAVCNLRALETLNVKNNKLTVLPGALGTLKCLKTFIASDNQLEFLPGSIKLLKLWFLDVTDNPFVFRTPRSVRLEYKTPSLLEWAARCVINNRVRHLCLLLVDQNLRVRNITG
ncbi:Leucine-rich repeat protein soc-2 homolog, partial [Gryllus bimaculatus]